MILCEILIICADLMSFCYKQKQALPFPTTGLIE